MIEMSLRRVSSEKDVVVLGENWLRTASQVCEALGQGCPDGLQFFRRCKSAILMSLMMMMMMMMMMILILTSPAGGGLGSKKKTYTNVNIPLDRVLFGGKCNFETAK